MILYLPVGVPYCGKSTYYKKRLEKKGVEYLNSDLIRKELFGAEEIQSNPKAVFSLMQDRAEELLSNGKDVYYDATNLSLKNRTSLINRMRNKFKNLEIVAISFFVPLEVIKERQKKRERFVAYSTILKMLHSYTPVSFYEKVDKILIERVKSNRDIMRECMIEQHNSHHTMTVYNHMLAANRYYADYSLKPDVPYRIEISTALMFHDIGKPFTQVFYDMKGNKTEEAHYYGHEGVGAYLYLTYFGLYDTAKEFKNSLYISLLIRYHMGLYNKNGLGKNLTKIMGEKFLRDLEALHHCDEYAH